VAAKKVRAVGFGHRRAMIEPNLKKNQSKETLSIAVDCTFNGPIQTQGYFCRGS
jgi:hypothetical protein